MRVEGLSVDGEHNVQELALGTEGGEALQEAGTMAGRRERAPESSVFVGRAAGEQRWGLSSAAAGPPDRCPGAPGLARLGSNAARGAISPEPAPEKQNKTWVPIVSATWPPTGPGKGHRFSSLHVPPVRGAGFLLEPEEAPMSLLFLH